MSLNRMRNSLLVQELKVPDNHFSSFLCSHTWTHDQASANRKFPLQISNTDLLLLSRFSRVRLCATPEMAAHQAPPSLGFSRQEHWSGLPFPSPMHESEKWKWSRSVLSDCSWPHGLQPTRLPLPWDFPGKSTGVGCHCLLWNTDLVMYRSRKGRQPALNAAVGAAR